MTKITVDRVLIESELKALAAKGCGKCFAQDCDWPECYPRAKELRAALAEPVVEPNDEPYECPVCGEIDPSTSCGSPTCGLIAPPPAEELE